MRAEPEFILLTARGRRLPVWLRVWLAVAALAAGAVLFWFGLLLALVALLAQAAIRVPVLAWRAFRVNRCSRGPATIEGEYRIVARSAAEDRDDAQGWNHS